MFCVTHPVLINLLCIPGHSRLEGNTIADNYMQKTLPTGYKRNYRTHQCIYYLLLQLLHSPVKRLWDHEQSAVTPIIQYLWSIYLLT